MQAFRDPLMQQPRRLLKGILIMILMHDVITMSIMAAIVDTNTVQSINVQETDREENN